jgi:hypothetical protein
MGISIPLKTRTVRPAKGHSGTADSNRATDFVTGPGSAVHPYPTTEHGNHRLLGVCGSFERLVGKGTSEDFRVSLVVVAGGIVHGIASFQDHGGLVTKEAAKRGGL